jgi:hypothetical protein
MNPRHHSIMPLPESLSTIRISSSTESHQRSLNVRDEPPSLGIFGIQAPPGATVEPLRTRTLSLSSFYHLMTSSIKQQEVEMDKSGYHRTLVLFFLVLQITQ